MSKKDKYDKQIVKLTDDQIKNLRRQKSEVDLQVENSEIALYSLKKQIDLEIPMRSARGQLLNFEEQFERLKSNQKALEKQLRTKTIVNLVPKVTSKK